MYRTLWLKRFNEVGRLSIQWAVGRAIDYECPIYLPHKLDDLFSVCD